MVCTCFYNVVIPFVILYKLKISLLVFLGSKSELDCYNSKYNLWYEGFQAKHPCYH
jgi:hypothetical protein